MNTSSGFKLEFRIEFAHYAEATLQAPCGTYVCRCIDSVDGLGLLAKDVVRMLNPPVACAATKWEMDGQTLWVLDRRGDQIGINLIEFKETQQMLPSNRYATVYQFSRCAFFASVDFIEFVAEVARAFGDLETHGFDQDYDHWAQVYPSEQVGKLRKFLRSIRQ